MKSSQTIARESREANPYAFDRLRKEGISISQELSGSGWTDYNYHDPGVTILEQVCFALTDLIYRSKFDVADYLCDEEGEVNLDSLGLHAPQDVFFSRPTTITDLQKSLLDMSDGASLVNVTNGVESQNKGGYGLYSISVRQTQDNDGEVVDVTKLKRQVKENFYRVRNLCEDLDGEIEIATEIDCFLHAEISIKPDYRAASVLAELYFEAAAELAKPVSTSSYSEGLADGVSLDDQFSGPFTKKGLLSDEAIQQSKGKMNLRLLESAILARARSIPGIDYVASLRLRPTAGFHDTEDLPPSAKFRLKKPVAEVDLQGVRVSVSGQVAFYSMDEFLAQLDTINFARSSGNFALEEDLLLATPKSGTFRNLAQYQSLQNQFPDVYGINQFGVPESYSPQRKAQALQLKSYLLLFEQVMSNYLANLNSISRVFSIADYDEATYYSGVLSDSEISSLDRIYPENAKEVIDDILSQIDDFIDRKSRMLDYLLALYGEEFRQDQLRGVNYYHNAEELERNIIFNKIRLLNRIKYASGDRAAAVNLTHRHNSEHTLLDERDQHGAQLESVSGLQYRSSIFLGFKHLTPRSLVREALRLGFDLDSAINGNGQSNNSSNRSIEKARSLFADTKDDIDSEKQQSDAMRERLRHFSLLQDPQVRQAVLVDGVGESNYKYRARTDELLLSVSAELSGSTGEDETDSEFITVLQGHGRSNAQKAAIVLRKLMIHLSVESEGMHVVEHILLRPSSYAEHSHEFKQLFANRISVIFPAWTARCRDPRFRELAERTVRQNCPAHISCEFHWLDFAQMCEFECLNEYWLSLRSDHNDSGSVDKASAALVKFLEVQRFRQSALSNQNHQYAQLKLAVSESVSQFAVRLKVRRDELELSKRRGDDEELSYLRGIEFLQSEIKRFNYYVVQHMRLLPEEASLEEDWSFYTGRASLVLPKLNAFHLGNGQFNHFHEIKNIVESQIQKQNDAFDVLSFHWLVPSDFKKFHSIYSNWAQSHNRRFANTSKLEITASRLTEALKRMEQRSDTTADTYSWLSILGDL
ncbi:MAG: hypothetical protein MI746_17275 [Pseudomonadales bacterium]|nr:hypothetical protein [Pseudomonadales bacterium]